MNISILYKRKILVELNSFKAILATGNSHNALTRKWCTK